MWIYRLARLNTMASRPIYHRASSNTGIDGLHVSGWPRQTCKLPDRFNTPLAHVPAVHKARMPRRHGLVKGETGGTGQRSQNTPKHKNAEPRKVSPLVSDLGRREGTDEGQRGCRVSPRNCGLPSPPSCPAPRPRPPPPSRPRPGSVRSSCRR